MLRGRIQLARMSRMSLSLDAETHFRHVPSDSRRISWVPQMHLLLGSQVDDDVRYIEGEDFGIEVEELARDTLADFERRERAERRS
jgi:hypothetical protein